MEYIKKEVEVPKETSELADAIAEVAVATKKALADGFQLGQDVPAIVSSAIQNLLPAIQGFEKLDDEAKGAPYKFGLAWGISGEKVYDSFAKTPEAPTEEPSA
jgi:hypothetical protein